ALQAVGCTIDTFGLEESQSFVPDFGKLHSFVSSCQPDIILLNNPHNPSGALYSHNDIDKFATDVSEFKCHILIDEAFIDYCPEASFVPKIEKHSNVIVIRSLTKFYAMPGLRVGYAVCNPALASKMKIQIETWPVSNVALHAARVAISDRKYDEAVRTKNEIARTQFGNELRKLPGLTVFPSSTNFLLVRLPVSNASNLAEWLILHRILIRCCSSFNVLNDSFIRLAVRNPEENLRFLELLSIWLRKDS
ncbi:histidinol-phosphate aminotransferase family protein, partial [bacterium]|nr:histidinol-phosphate aminotransferase family protein [bacterium]